MITKLLPSIINLTNSAIGAALMTIPFSFCECGIVLSFGLIFLISLITVTASEFLLMSGTYHRKTNYELLCTSCLGRVGKAILELNMLGMMYGSSIAFVIIIGDLGSELLWENFGFTTNGTLRSVVLIFISLTVITPLCLKKNIEHLANASALSLVFYLILIIHLILLESPDGPSQRKVAELRWWRASGMMKVIPIISFGFTIQTQIFPVFNSMSDPKSHDMKIVIRIATFLVCLCYSIIGFFGYWKFSQYKPKISADLLSMYPNSKSSTFMKVGFLSSVAISYPLGVFPMRASLYSLFYVKHSPQSNLSQEAELIPDKVFKRLTIIIIVSTFILGFVTTNIDMVLSLTGSFSGSIVLFILPALIYLKSNPMPARRWLAHFIFLFGIAILGLSFMSSWNETATENMTRSPTNVSAFVQ